MFCPDCGNELKEVDTHYSNPVLACSNGHHWEVTVNPVLAGAGYGFRRMAVVECPRCGNEVLKVKLHHNTKVCPVCHQQELDEWRMDSQESYCLLEIQPVVTTAGKLFQLQSRIEIHPYPNPTGYGGQGGFSIIGVNSEAEVEAAIANFHAEVEPLKAKGIKAASGLPW